MIIRQIKTWVNRLIDISGIISGYLVILMAALVLFEVFMRYFMKRSPMIADEFSAYLLVIISYLGVAWTWKENGHVRFTVLISKLPLKVAQWLKLITNIGAFFYTLILIWVSYSFLMHSIKLGMSSASWLRTPLQPFHSTLLIGFGILGLFLLVDIIYSVINITKSNNGKE